MSGPSPAPIKSGPPSPGPVIESIVTRNNISEFQVVKLDDGKFQASKDMEGGLGKIKITANSEQELQQIITNHKDKIELIEKTSIAAGKSLRASGNNFEHVEILKKASGANPQGQVKRDYVSFNEAVKTEVERKAQKSKFYEEVNRFLDKFKTENYDKKIGNSDLTFGDFKKALSERGLNDNEIKSLTEHFSGLINPGIEGKNYISTRVQEFFGAGKVENVEQYIKELQSKIQNKNLAFEGRSAKIDELLKKLFPQAKPVNDAAAAVSRVRTDDVPPIDLSSPPMPSSKARKLAQSAKPAESAQSTKPAQRTQSAQSAEPAESAESAQSTKPAQRTQSAQSAEPAESAESAQSTKPARRTQSAQSAQSAKPTESAGRAEPEYLQRIPKELKDKFKGSNKCLYYFESEKAAYDLIEQEGKFSLVLNDRYYIYPFGLNQWKVIPNLGGEIKEDLAFFGNTGEISEFMKADNFGFGDPEELVQT